MADGEAAVSAREQVHALVRASGVLEGDERLLVLVSGGRDSTCLLDVCVALRGADGVSALHVNYGLRERAGADELHVRALCERLAVVLDVVHPASQPPAPPGRQGASGNLQAWARELRYGEARARVGDGLIATGHTASDQVETILYRLAASPGRRALLGMAAREDRLVRPLLGVTRAQTAAYCEQSGLPWREDESNSDARFARSRVRHELLPALRSLHPGAERNVLRTAALLREEAGVLEEIVAAELSGGDQVELDRLASLPPPIARLVLIALAERAGNGFVPQAGSRLAELLELGARGGRAELHVGGNVGAVVERGRLSMVALPPRGAGAGH